MTLTELKRHVEDGGWDGGRDRLVASVYLTGVDHGILANKKSDYAEDAGCFCFILNGEAFCATEDPSDGYRSSMADLQQVPIWTVRNTFAPVLVTLCMTADDNILEVSDAKTGQIVIEVGTDNADDYYPRFVGSFSPQNMSVNAGVAAFEHEDKIHDGQMPVRRGMKLVS